MFFLMCLFAKPIKLQACDNVKSSKLQVCKASCWGTGWFVPLNPVSLKATGCSFIPWVSSSVLSLLFYFCLKDELADFVPWLPLPTCSLRINPSASSHVTAVGKECCAVVAGEVVLRSDPLLWRTEKELLCPPALGGSRKSEEQELYLLPLKGGYR